MDQRADCVVSSLGPCDLESPLVARSKDLAFEFVGDEESVLVDAEGPYDPRGRLEKAGPRARVFFDAPRSRAAIATCGGLCPGINNAVRSLVLQLHHFYGVQQILGVRDGFGGILPNPAHEPVLLTPEYTGKRVVLAGYTDASGIKFQANLNHSFKRAAQVRAALLVAGGKQLDQRPIAAKGFGPLAPVACNDTAEGQRLNRRVEVWVRD